MKATDLIESLTRKLGTTSQGELAAALGVSVGTLINWKNRDEDLSANQVASALAKSREAAVDESQLRAIQPIVEFYTIDRCLTKQEKSWQVFNGGSGASKYAQGVKAELEGSYGIYIFYDSRGQALYVGKAREQSLWRKLTWPSIDGAMCSPSRWLAILIGIGSSSRATKSFASRNGSVSSCSTWLGTSVRTTWTQG